jgi:hypothetical protein
MDTLILIIKISSKVSRIYRGLRRDKPDPPKENKMPLGSLHCAGL